MKRFQCYEGKKPVELNPGHTAWTSKCSVTELYTPPEKHQPSQSYNKRFKTMHSNMLSLGEQKYDKET